MFSCFKSCCPKVKQVLPELVEMLPNDDSDTQLPVEVTASLCHILNNLSQSDKQHVRAIVNEGALPKIISISIGDTGSVCLTNTQVTSYVGFCCYHMIIFAVIPKIRTDQSQSGSLCPAAHHVETYRSPWQLQEGGSLSLSLF